MHREPNVKGAAFLVTYKRAEIKRKFLLALHDSEPGQLSAVSAKLRELSAKYAKYGWSVQPKSVAEAAQTEANFRFALQHFVSDNNSGALEVHEDLLNRVIQRLLSDAPGIDFFQKSGVARGNRFFDRPDTRKTLLDAAQNHRWILLEAVRRFGKTSFLVNLEDNQPENATAVYLSLERGSSQEYLPRMLVAHAVCNSDLRKILPEELQNISTPESTPYELMDRFAGKKRNAYKDLKLCWQAFEQNKHKVIFLIDELVLYLLNLKHTPSEENEWRKTVNKILDMLYNDAPEHVHFILAGSLHLPAFLESQAIRHPLLDKLYSMPLAPVTPRDAETMFRLAFLQEELIVGKDELDWMLERFGGWLPSFSLYFIDLLGRICRDRKQLTMEDLLEQYNSLFSPLHRALFSDLDFQHIRQADYADEPDFGIRLCFLLVSIAEAGDTGADRAEIEQAFTQSREWDPGVEEVKKDRMLDLAVTIAKQDYSVIETEGRYVVGCKLLSDWIISRRSEWRVD